MTHLADLLDLPPAPPANRQTTVDFGGAPLLVGWEHDEDVLPPFYCTDVCIGGVWMAADSVLQERVVNALCWAVTEQMQGQAQDDADDAAIERASAAREAFDAMLGSPLRALGELTARRAA